MGQLKGFLDRYRNPETQTRLADRLGQNPAVLASFADGSKLALEAAIMGNATGFVPQVRGMNGHPLPTSTTCSTSFTPDDFAHGRGWVEYALGAAPHTGAFVICHNDHPDKRKLMAYLKMGEGPLYMFYQPYHLPPWQIAHSVARAALFNDPTITPRGAPVCDTVSYAKRDLRAGETPRRHGRLHLLRPGRSLGVCRAANYLPIAVSLDCRLMRDVPKDTPSPTPTSNCRPVGSSTASRRAGRAVGSGAHRRHRRLAPRSPWKTGAFDEQNYPPQLHPLERAACPLSRRHPRRRAHLCQG